MKPDLLEGTAVPVILQDENVRIFIYKSLVLVGKVISCAVYQIQKDKGLTWD